MKKGIIGGALLFASACGTAEPGEGVAVDAAADTAVDGAGSDTGAVPTDTEAGDAGLLDVGAIDGGEIDGGKIDGGKIDGGVADAGLVDGGPKDGGTTTADIGMSDASLPPDGSTDAGGLDDAAGDTVDASCEKPDPKDAQQMIGTACAQDFQAVCDAAGQVVIMCQGSKWSSWTGGNCSCFHTACGPDQASCIAVGFVGIARAGRVRKVGRVLRRYA